MSEVAGEKKMTPQDELVQLQVKQTASKEELMLLKASLDELEKQEPMNVPAIREVLAKIKSIVSSMKEIDARMDVLLAMIEESKPVVKVLTPEEKQAAEFAEAVASRKAAMAGLARRTGGRTRRRKQKKNKKVAKRKTGKKSRGCR